MARTGCDVDGQFAMTGVIVRSKFSALFFCLFLADEI
jgi:hypothetical protein